MPTRSRSTRSNFKVSSTSARSPRAAAPALRPRPLGRGPVEATERHDQALFLPAPADIGHLDEGILQMGGDDLEVVPVEGDELHRLHDARSLPSFPGLMLPG